MVIMQMQAMLLECLWGLENYILLMHVGLACDFTNSQTFWRLRLIKVCTDQTDTLPSSESFD